MKNETKYHRGNGQVVVPEKPESTFGGQHTEFEYGKWQDYIFSLPVVAQCDPTEPIGWLQGYVEDYQVKRQGIWKSCIKAQYDLTNKHQLGLTRIFLVRKDRALDNYIKDSKSLVPADKNIKYLIEDKRTERWYKLGEMMDTSKHDNSYWESKWTNDPNEAIQWDTKEEAEAFNKKYFNMPDIEVTEHEFVPADKGDEKTNNLLDCPFCGGRPEWVNLAHPSGIPALQCPECQFKMQQDRRDKTIFYWNRRQTPLPNNSADQQGELWDLWLSVRDDIDEYYSHPINERPPFEILFEELKSKYRLSRNVPQKDERDDFVTSDNATISPVVSLPCTAPTQMSNLGEWQLCPKCLGGGFVYNPHSMVTSVTEPCDVCHGAKIIAKPILSQHTKD